MTVEEIKVLLEQGTEEGVFEATEHDIVTNVLNLDERHVGAVLTPRSDVVYLDVRDSLQATREKLRGDVHSVFPLCDGGLDHVLGFARSTKALDQLIEKGMFDPSNLAEPALFVPETMPLMKLLGQFNEHISHWRLSLTNSETWRDSCWLSR